MNYNPETLDPMSVAEQQRELGAQWANVYANEPNKSAEIALRNPLVYLRDVPMTTLPDNLQASWEELLDTTDKLVSAAATSETEWGADVSSIEKLQQKMFTGDLKPEYSLPIAEIIRDASALFADSSQLRGGNTQYYAGNIKGMQSWIERYR